MGLWDEYDDSINGSLMRVRLTKVDDSGKQQLVTVEGIKGQTIGEAVRLQHFGATNVPPEGSEGVALISGGRFDRIHILGLEHPDKRPTKLPGGSKAIYDASGNIIRLVGDKVEMDFGSHPWTVKFKGGTLTSDGVDVYFDPKGAGIYLGGKSGDSFAKVSTVSGPSKNVYAAI